jgi:hypothetical protein
VPGVVIGQPASTERQEPLTNRKASNRGSEDCGTRAPRFPSLATGPVECGANLMEDDRIDD